MKKQILLFVLFVVATFASVSKSYGQGTCTPSEIAPAVGHEYTYSATNAGTGAKYDWYVTKDLNLVDNTKIAAEGTFFTVNSATPYHSSTGGTKDIKITWTQAAIIDGGPFYLVLRYSETSTSTTACTVENIKATEIKPINTFLLAFEGGTLTGGTYTSTVGSNTCAANVTGATVTSASPSTVLITYGQNTLYYVATASGINGDWYPQIQLPALNTSQKYVSADWTSDMTGGTSATWNSFGTVNDGSTHDLLSTAKATASETGTPILIRVVIDNVNWQTLSDQEIILGLDGFLPPTPIVVSGTGASKSDITSTTNCTELGAFGRTAKYTINKRPTLSGTPAFLGLTNP